jgi:hypothetical protein
VLGNPESHPFGLPVVGSAGSLLLRRAGVRTRTFEGDPGRSSVSVSSSSSMAAATVVVLRWLVARARSARGKVVPPAPRSSSSRARSSTSLSSEGERRETQLHSAHLFGSQGSRQRQQQDEERPLSPLILSQSVQSEDTTMMTRTITLAQAMSEAPSQAPTRAHTPAGVPIPSSPLPPPQSSPHHRPGDLSTASISFVTAPPTIISRTTDSGGDGRTPDILNEGAGATEHSTPPHTRGFVRH